MGEGRMRPAVLSHATSTREEVDVIGRRRLVAR